MKGPKPTAKRAAAGRLELGWGAGWAAGLGGVADATGAGRSIGAGGTGAGPRLIAGAGDSADGAAAGPGGGVTERGAGSALVGPGAGDSRRWRKISFGRCEPPNQPRRQPASPPSAASSATTTAPIRRRFDFGEPNIRSDGMSKSVGSPPDAASDEKPSESAAWLDAARA